MLSVNFICVFLSDFLEITRAGLLELSAAVVLTHRSEQRATPLSPYSFKG